MIWTAIAAGGATAAAAADRYPARPVRLVVPFPPGGGTDLVARLVAQRLSESLGQSIIVDNRPGAGTMLATELVMRAPADGYTLMICSASHALNPSLYGKVNYDPLRDFAAITLAVAFPFLLVVHPAVQAQTVKDYIALAKAQPGKIAYASSGIGSTNHLAGELFKVTAGVDITHIPYKGGGPALNDLIGGQIPSMFGTVLETWPHARGGRIRALGVTSAKRGGFAPDLPTIAEAALPGYDVTGWYGFLVPAATPKPIVAKLNREITRILGEAAVKGRLVSLGSDPWPTSPDEAQKFIGNEAARWSKIIRGAGIRAE